MFFVVVVAAHAKVRACSGAGGVSAMVPFASELWDWEAPRGVGGGSEDPDHGVLLCDAV